MSVENLRATIDRVVMESLGLVRSGAANVPKWTGRLRSAIKMERTGNQLVVYIESGNMSVDEWEDAYNMLNIEQAPWGEAPYAQKVEDRKPYWERVWLFLYQRLRTELTGLGSSFNYHPTGKQ